MRISTRVLSVASLVFVLGLSVLPGCQSTPSAEARKKFLAAERAFAAADSADEYLEVAARYQELLESGHRSAAVYYNQGLAYMEAREPARAIAAFRLAKRYRPRDPRLASLLQRAREATDRGAMAASPPSYTARLQHWLSLQEKCWLITAILLASFGGGALFLLRGWGRAARRMTWVGLGICLVIAISAAVDVYRFEVLSHAVVVHEGFARRGAATLHEPVWPNELAVGTELIVRERRNDWVHIHWPGHGEGWMRAKDLIIF